jgi:molecular chaperone HtpG
VTDVVAVRRRREADESGKYTRFYAEFGAVLKEGLGEDFANKDRLAKLLRFASTTSDTVSVCFADYKARMKEGQEAIYYITADTLAAAKNSPQLEVFKKKGIEVLLMTDRVDEWALELPARIRRHARCRAWPRAQSTWASSRTRPRRRLPRKPPRPSSRLLGQAQRSAQGQGRRRARHHPAGGLSPACLVVQDDGMSTQLARMLKQAGQTAPEVKPVLEVNAEHPLVKKLDGSVHFHDLAHILFRPGPAGRRRPACEDPAAYVKRVNALLT